MKKIPVVLMIVLLFLVLLSSCTQKVLEDKGKITITIDATSVDKGFILTDYTVSLNEYDTVFDVTFSACKDNNILMSSRGVSAARYVEGIADLYEFDYGPTSGWVFYVNEESASKSSGVYELKEGDVVRWEYVTE